MNTNDVFQIFGYLASANACLMMLPQLFLTIKKKSFSDLSIKMISMNLLTQILFLPYSTHFNLYPLIIVNTMLATCDIVILVYYFYYRKKDSNDDLIKDLLYDVFQDSTDP
tara:strand:+ start:202 stop:534 length:333 start_codon:yes stop_codon:yes gene_type:complete